MMWWTGGFHWGWMAFGGLMMLLFWGGLIGLAVVIVRSFAGPADRSHRPTAMDLLEERYARGELTKKEFESMRSDLRA